MPGSNRLTMLGLRAPLLFGRLARALTKNVIFLLQLTLIRVQTQSRGFVCSMSTKLITNSRGGQSQREKTPMNFFGVVTWFLGSVYSELPKNLQPGFSGLFEKFIELDSHSLVSRQSVVLARLLQSVPHAAWGLY